MNWWCLVKLYGKIGLSVTCGQSQLFQTNSIKNFGTVEMSGNNFVYINALLKLVFNVSLVEINLLLVTFSAESFSNPLPPAHEEYIDQDDDDYERYELIE